MADKMVVGVYSNENDVISAIRRLHEMGCESDQISVLAQNPERFGNLQNLTDIVPEAPKSTAGGAATGAVTGGILGGLGALLVSLGVLAIPGVGPFLAAGPVVAAIGGAAGGAAIGGVVGALIGLGVDKGDAQDYQHALERGDLLVMVRADETRYNRVSDIFRYPEEEYYRRYDRDPALPWNASHADVGSFPGNLQDPHTPPMAGVAGMGHAALDVDRADGAANDRHHIDDIHPDDLRERSFRSDGEHRRADGSVGLGGENPKPDEGIGRPSGLAGGGDNLNRRGTFGSLADNERPGPGMTPDDDQIPRHKAGEQEVTRDHAQDGQHGMRRDTWLHESVADHDVETPGHNDLDDTNIHEPEHNRHHNPEDTPRA